VSVRVAETGLEPRHGHGLVKAPALQVCFVEHEPEHDEATRSAVRSPRKTEGDLDRISDALHDDTLGHALDGEDPLDPRDGKAVVHLVRGGVSIANEA